MAGKNHVTGRITRKEFIRRAGIGASIVGAAAMGLSGKARAQASPGTSPDATNIIATSNGFEVYPTNIAPPSGMISPSQFLNLNDGDRFSIDDGMHGKVVFEMNKNKYSNCVLTVKSATKSSYTGQYFTLDDGTGNPASKFYFVTLGTTLPARAINEYNVDIRTAATTTAIASAINGAINAVSSPLTAVPDPLKITSYAWLAGNMKLLTVDVPGPEGSPVGSFAASLPSTVLSATPFSTPRAVSSPNWEVDITTSSTAVAIGTMISNAVANAREAGALNLLSNFNPVDGSVYLTYSYISDISSDGNGVVVSGEGTPSFPQVVWNPSRYPNGDVSPTNDVRNIQWAINNAPEKGTVILKQYTLDPATPLQFNFGMSGKVSFTNNITLSGEASSRQPLNDEFGYGGYVLEGTTIFGGFNVIQIGAFTGFKTSYAVVKDIIFESTNRMPLGNGYSEGYVEISGCNVRNLRRGGGGNGGPTGAFQMISHGGTSLEEMNRLKGTLIVRNNHFGIPVKPDPNNPGMLIPENLINSVTHFSNCERELIELRGNEIECIWAGILVMVNKGFTRITGNKVMKIKTGINGSEGPAICIGGYPGNSLFMTNWGYEGSGEITNNDVVVGSPTPDIESPTNGWGIAIGNYPATQFNPAFTFYKDVPGPFPRQMPDPPSTYLISGNRITMHKNYVTNVPNKVAIYLAGSASNVICKDNLIAGNASYGVLVSRASAVFAAPPNADSFLSNNNFSGNDFTGFMAANSQVYLDPFTLNNYFGPGTDASTGEEHGGNSFGPSGLYQAIVQGNSNIFDSNTFGSSRWEQMDIANASADKTRLDSGCYNLISNNVFGPVLNFPPGDPLYSPREAVRIISGDFNQLIKNDYTQTGLPGLTDPNGPPSGTNMPCISLTSLSGSNKYAENNLVFESGGFPVVNGVETDAKTQVFDALLLPWSPTYPNTNNRVIGHSANTYQSAVYKNSGIGQSLQAAGGELDCVLSGGAWDPAAKVCSCPAGCTLNPATGKCEKALAPEDTI